MNTTIRAESGDTRADFWTDHATVLRREAADGVFHAFAALHGGPFAAMIRLVSGLPQHDRDGLVIEKSGDRRYGPAEIMTLARRADFPG